MLLTKKEDILKAMEENLEDASDSTINWLADSFNVPLNSEPKAYRRLSGDYFSSIPLLMEELRTRTLAEAERERNLSPFRCTVVRIGRNSDFCPKTMKKARRYAETPDFRRLTRLIASIEEQNGL